MGPARNTAGARVSPPSRRHEERSGHAIAHRTHHLSHPLTAVPDFASGSGPIAPAWISRDSGDASAPDAMGQAGTSNADASRSGASGQAWRARVVALNWRVGRQRRPSWLRIPWMRCSPQPPAVPGQLSWPPRGAERFTHATVRGLAFGFPPGRCLRSRGGSHRGLTPRQAGYPWYSLTALLCRRPGAGTRCGGRYQGGPTGGASAPWWRTSSRRRGKVGRQFFNRSRALLRSVRSVSSRMTRHSADSAADFGRAAAELHKPSQTFASAAAWCARCQFASGLIEIDGRRLATAHRVRQRDACCTKRRGVARCGSAIHGALRFVMV